MQNKQKSSKIATETGKKQKIVLYLPKEECSGRLVVCLWLSLHNQHRHHKNMLISVSSRLWKICRFRITKRQLELVKKIFSIMSMLSLQWGIHCETLQLTEMASEWCRRCGWRHRRVWRRIHEWRRTHCSPWKTVY